MMWVMYQIRLPIKNSSPLSNFWIDEMKDEMTSMSQNKVWSLVYFPDGCRPIGYKWVFKT